MGRPAPPAGVDRAARQRRADAWSWRPGWRSAALYFAGVISGANIAAAAIMIFACRRSRRRRWRRRIRMNAARWSAGSNLQPGARHLPDAQLILTLGTAGSPMPTPPSTIFSRDRTGRRWRASRGRWPIRKRDRFRPVAQPVGHRGPCHRGFAAARRARCRGRLVQHRGQSRGRAAGLKRNRGCKAKTGCSGSSLGA